MTTTIDNPETAIEVAAPPAAPLARSALMPTQSEMANMVQISNAIAKSGMPLPKDCRTPEAVFAKLLIGWEHGLGPMTAINNIYNIDGKMSLPEEVKVAVIRSRRLGDIRTVEATDQRAVVEVTRPDLPSPVRVAFTVDDAVQAGLLRRTASGDLTSNKDTWVKWRASMLLARARAYACHRYFEEVFTGLPYSPAELGADTDERGRLVDVPAFEPPPPPPWQAPPSTQSPPTPPAPADPPPVSPQPDARAVTSSASAETAAPPAGGPDAQQIERARVLKAALKLDANQWVAQLQRVQPGATSLKQMTPAMAGAILCRLENLHTIRTLRQWGGIAGLTPEQWERALAKRGVTSDLDLSDKDLLEIRDKLWDKVTPFDRQKLGLEPAPAQAQGNVSASSPPSPPWPTTPLSEAA